VIPLGLNEGHSKKSNFWVREGIFGLIKEIEN
jgi:hypothetical protein